MPYIPKSERRKIDTTLASAGSLNYAVHQLIDKYIDQHDVNYQTINDVIGVLECAKMELYRRGAIPYENKKILQNGDCAPYTNWLSDKPKLS